MLNSLATLTMTDILRPKPQGEPVNRHVFAAVEERLPDYAAMNRLVSNPSAVPPSRDGKETTTASSTG